MPDIKNRKTLVSEVVSPIQEQFSQFLSYMPNPDLLLEQTGESLEMYRTMLIDGRISSLIDLRKAKVLMFPFSISPGDDSSRGVEIADFVQTIFKSFNLYHEMKELLSAFEFGFSFTEVVWKIKNDGIWIPDRFENRKQERFSFRPDGTAVIMDNGVEKTLTQPYKFIIHIHNREAENPYGNSVLRQAYWPWIFKRAGFRFWLTASEKFGVPTVLAIFDTDDEDKARQRAQELSEALAGIQNDAAVAMSNVREVSTLEVKGDLDGFKTLIECCNNEISYAISGQSLSTAEGKYGTRAQAEVHEETFQSLIVGDAINLAYTISKTVIAWMTELNYGPDAPQPIMEFETQEYASWEIVRDAIDRGLPVSRNTLYTRYNIPNPKNDEDAFVYQKTQPVDQPSLEFADTSKKKRKMIILNRN